MSRLPAVLLLSFPFLCIAAFFLWTEHTAHLMGMLPWILLAASCVLLALSLLRGRAADAHPEMVAWSRP